MWPKPMYANGPYVQAHRPHKAHAYMPMALRPFNGPTYGMAQA